MKAIELAWRVSKPWMRITAILLLVVVLLPLLDVIDKAMQPEEVAPEMVRASTPPVVPSTPVDDDHLGAKLICQKFVANSLKAPATARFSSISETSAIPSTMEKFRHLPNAWDSVGYVDAQNSFGALIRNEYFCTMQRTGPDKWGLLDLSVWVKTGP